MLLNMTCGLFEMMCASYIHLFHVYSNTFHSNQNGSVSILQNPMVGPDTHRNRECWLNSGFNEWSAFGAAVFLPGSLETFLVPNYQTDITRERLGNNVICNSKWGQWG
jgi:hypothetical protein